MKISLGTVQFGLDYGISNSAGKPSLDVAAAILDCAYANGIGILDTAPAYGVSEAVLGDLGAARRFQIVTKTPQRVKGDQRGISQEAVRRSFERSLQQLRTARVEVLMVHSADDLLCSTGDDCYAALDALKADQSIGKIGVSVYRPDELSTLLDRYPLDVVQVPFNLLDRRFLASGCLARCKQSGTTVFARSTFLQGLLLMAPHAIPARAAAARPSIELMNKRCRELQVAPLAACLGHSLNEPLVDSVVLGVTSESELKEIVSVSVAARERTWSRFDDLANEDERVIDPRYWL